MAFQFDQLRTLVALVDEGSFEAAARRLHLTQSAVSQRVKAMEQEAGSVLVRRTAPVTTTAAGDVLLRYARQVELLDADAARDLAGDAAGGTTTVPLAVNADTLATWFLPAVADVVVELGVALDVRREDQDHTTRLLRDGTVLAAVTSTAEPVQGCTSTPLGVSRYLAVASPAYRDRHLVGVGLEALAAAPRLDFDRQDELQRGFVHDVVGAVDTAPRHYVPTSSDFARSVELGLGWGLLPEDQCLEQLAAGRLVDVAPGRHVDVALWWQRWNLTSPLLDRLSEAVLAGAWSHLRPVGR